MSDWTPSRMRSTPMGHTETSAAVGHEAWPAAAWCAGILVAAYAGASRLFRHRTAA